MATKEIINGDWVERVEIDEAVDKKVRELLSTHPQGQILSVYLDAQAARKKEVSEKFNAFNSELQKRLSDAQAALDKVKGELGQEVRARQEADRAGQYTAAFQSDLKIAELGKAVLRAEANLAQVNLAVAGERYNYKQTLANSQGVAALGGIDYVAFYNAARADLSEWYQEMTANDVANIVREQFREAAYDLQSARIWAAEAQEKLGQYQPQAGAGQTQATGDPDAISDFNNKWGLKKYQPAAAAAVRKSVEVDQGNRALAEIAAATGRHYGNPGASQGLPTRNQPQPQPQLDPDMMPPQYRNK
jgi:hypothetical protein